MDEFKQRVIVEKKELDEKLTKLNEFLAKDKPSFITDYSWQLLSRQQVAMTAYSDVLDERITDFSK